MPRRLFAVAAVAALFAALALALFVLRIVVSVALLVAGLVALALGYAWLTQRRADRDAATR